MGKKVENSGNKLNRGMNPEIMYKKLVDCMNEAVWVGDEHEKTVYANPKFCDLMGYTLDEMIGKVSYDFWDKESAEIVKRENKHKRKKGVSSSYEGSLLTKNGGLIPVLLNGTALPWGGTIGIMTDLRILKEKEKKERITSHIIRNSYEAIVVLDEGRRVVLWNQGAARTFGYKEKEILGKSINTIIPPSGRDGSDRILEEVEEKGFVRGVETKRVTKGGKVIDVTISLSKVTGIEGDFVGYLATYVDITDKKRASNELQKRFEIIQDTYKELGLQKRQIDYMQEISNLAVSDSSLPALENLIVSAITLLTKADAAILRFYDQKTDSLKLRACVGVSEAWWSKDKIQMKNNLINEAVKNKRAIIVDEVATDSRYVGAKLAKAHNFRTLIIIPLFINDIVIGSLNIYSINPSKFRFIETDFLENFGKICALSIYVKRITSGRVK